MDETADFPPIEVQDIDHPGFVAGKASEHLIGPGTKPERLNETIG